MDVVFFGSGSFGLPALDGLKKSSHRLLAVVTMPDKPKGRHFESTASPIKRWALENQISVFDYRKDALPALEKTLRALDPAIFVVTSFGAILPSSLLSLPRIMPLNLHASLLPRYRGASPIQQAILSGDDRTGITVIRMTEKLDAGDVVLFKETALLDSDDYVSLETRLAKLASQALLEALAQLTEGKAVLIPQDQRKATYTSKIKAEDGRIRWSEEARLVARRVRALCAWPTCFFLYKGKRILVHAARAVDSPSVLPAKPGAVLANDGRLVISAQKGALEILRLQLEGKKPLDAAEFLRGFRIEPGALVE